MKRLGNVGDIVYDGKRYWIEGVMGPSYIYNPQKNRYKAFAFNHSPFGSVLCMEPVKGNMWFGVYPSGVVLYNPKSDQFKMFDYQDGLPYVLSGDDKFSKVMSLVFDPFENCVWAGMAETGLVYYDLNKKKWNVVEDSDIKNKDVFSLAVGKKILVAAGEQGLYIRERNNRKWNQCYLNKTTMPLDCPVIDGNRVYFVQQVEENSTIMYYDVSTKEVKKLFEWNAGINDLKRYDQYLVFGSNQGLTFYNFKTGKVKTFTALDGLMTNYVNCVYFTDDELWVTTQDGIVKGKLNKVLKALKATL